MAERQYIVGLPVGITVRDDGSVHASVDMAEFSSAMWEDQNGGFKDPEYQYTDAQVEADVATVSAAFDGHAITAGVMHQEGDDFEPSDELRRFLDQNERCAATMTHLQTREADGFAEHHAGGLFVLGRYAESGPLYIKMHDSWGDDDNVVVHAYDPDADPETDPAQTETYFAKGRDAFELFLNYEQRLESRLCRYCGKPEAEWDAGDCTVSGHGYHIPLGASDVIHAGGELGSGTPLCGTEQEAIITGNLDEVTCFMCQQALGGTPQRTEYDGLHADLDVERVRVQVVRSAGVDGAIVVLIDTEFEPDGSDGGPGLRVLINDDPTYEGKPYQPKEEK